jgi:hypothetical protein
MTDVLNSGNVTVVARRPPVTINNDTVEFNTENFKTQPNAVVEDMLKKLPGVTVDNDGTVRVNGQRVNRVLVNGKEFFTGDPKMATKNLDADAVDKVQVFDKKSDRAEFTGVDDGQSEKTINLKLKKDRNNACLVKYRQLQERTSGMMRKPISINLMVISKCRLSVWVTIPINRVSLFLIS